MKTKVPHPAKPTTSCIEWDGARLPTGYGARTINGRWTLVHRWAVETIEGRPLEPGEVVMHLCDNPPCYRYDHLKRSSQSENIHDALAKGRHRYVAHRGVSNGGGGKLTETQAREIKVRSDLTQREIAAEYGVSVSLVEKIRAGQLWGWLS